MALSADVYPQYDASVAPLIETYPVTNADILYEGGALGLDGSGYAKPLAGTDTQFIGFCAEQVDNAAGAAGAKNVQVRTRGKAKLTVVGASALTDVGSKVYATADNVFTLSSTGAKLIGKVARWISSTTCIVYFEADCYDVNS